MTAATNMTPGYYTRTLHGHRAAYLDFFQRKLGGNRISAIDLYWVREPVIFLMIEESFALYASVAIWRSFLRRRTIGLLFRPRPAIEGTSLKLRLKRTILTWFRKLPTVFTISIVPTLLDERIGAISDSWIFDPQLWDLTPSDRDTVSLQRNSVNIGSSEVPEIVRLVKEFKQTRPLLVALGLQNRDKGINHLSEWMDKGATSGWAVVVAGRFVPESHNFRASILSNGGLIIDRHLTDKEMLAMYSMASAVWALYDPGYDQASGILGRAVQLSVPCIVRTGSLSAKFCLYYGIPFADADGKKTFEIALSEIINPDVEWPESISNTFETKSMAVLDYALVGKAGNQKASS